jgi:HAD superfamily hydrolase (TIGR01509 family)
VDRENSLRLLLGAHGARFTDDEQAAFRASKNAEYVTAIETVRPADLLPGARALLLALRAAGIPAAVASSSKNARRVVELLEIGGLLDGLVDGSLVARAKPDPELFLLAAARIGVMPAHCVVVEDAEAGVQAALAGGMMAIGIGDPARVGAAHRVCAGVAEISVPLIRELMAAPVTA